MSNTIKVTLVKSLIGRQPKHVLIAKQLGLRKINSSSVRQDNPSVRGMIAKIDYMLCVQESK